MIQVIFFITSPFCQRDYERYGMDIFINNGFDVYVWDIMQAVYPHLSGVAAPVVDPIEWDRHRVFKTQKDVAAALKHCATKTIIIDPEAFNIKTFKIYRAISKNKIPYIVTPISGIPPIHFVETIQNRFLKIKKIFNLKKLINYIARFLPLSFLRIAPPTFVITEGLKCNFARPGVSNKTKIIRSHALDYDIYQRLEETQELQDEVITMLGDCKTAVFLDNYMPHHTDILFSGTKCPVTPEVYYKELCRLFDKIEEQERVKIIIAAHPRANYIGHEQEYFGARVIIRNKTAKLVKASQFVINNTSTSVSFAVLYKKPILFFTTDELNSSTDYDYERFAYEWAALLGCRPINISKDNYDADIDYNINESLYKKYLNDYIKVDGSAALSHPQIVCNAITENWYKYEQSIDRMREIHESI